MVLLLYFRPFDNSEFALNLRGLFFIFIIVLRILKRFPKKLDLAYDFQWFNFFFSSQKEFLFSTDSSIICSLNNLKHPIYRLTRTSGVERQRARKSQNSLALKLSGRDLITLKTGQQNAVINFGPLSEPLLSRPLIRRYLSKFSLFYRIIGALLQGTSQLFGVAAHL